MQGRAEVRRSDHAGGQRGPRRRAAIATSSTPAAKPAASPGALVRSEQKAPAGNSCAAPAEVDAEARGGPGIASAEAADTAIDTTPSAIEVAETAVITPVSDEEKLIRLAKILVASGTAIAGSRERAAALQRRSRLV
jgi:hypothetical protein